MKIYNTIFSLTILAFTGSSYAQPQQTVEGANKFFAQIVADGHASTWAYVGDVPIKEFFVVRVSKLFVSGWYEAENKTKNIKVPYETKIEGLPFQYGCVWRIGVTVPDRFKREYKHVPISGRVETTSYGDMPVVEMGIDWGRVNIKRNAGKSAIQISVKNPKYAYELLEFKADPEMLDRIEYAAKFLQMSCDKTAATGF